MDDYMITIDKRRLDILEKQIFDCRDKYLDLCKVLNLAESYIDQGLWNNAYAIIREFKKSKQGQLDTLQADSLRTLKTIKGINQW